MKEHSEAADITIHSDNVVIRRRGISRTVVAGILELKNDTHGVPQRIVLDRRVHAPRITRFGDWEVTGAVVSVLTRPIEDVAE